MVKIICCFGNTFEFSLAAATLYMTQPALSKQISLLEEVVGAPLFYRTKRSVILTDAEKAFLPEAENLLQRTEDAINFARKAASDEPSCSKSLSLAFNDLFPFSFFANTPILNGLDEFKQKNPSITIDYQFLNHQKMETGINNHSIDLAVSIFPHKRISSPMFAQWDYITLKKDYWVLSVPKEYHQADIHDPAFRKSLNKLYFFIQKDDPYFLTDRLEALEKHGLEPRIQICSSWQESIMRTEMGEGFYMLPSAQIAQSFSPQAGFITLPKNNSCITIDTVVFWHKKNANSIIHTFINDELSDDMQKLE